MTIGLGNLVTRGDLGPTHIQILCLVTNHREKPMVSGQFDKYIYIYLKRKC